MLKYPMRLKQCEYAPLNLFYKGNIDLLSDNEMHIDAIAESLSWGFSKVANELLHAEFKGITLPLPGKIYKKNI